MIVYARFESGDAVERRMMVILAHESSYEVLDHRIFKAVPTATHALPDAV